MTRKERLLAAVRRQPVDRMPYATYNFHPCGTHGHEAEPTYAEMLQRVRDYAGAFIKVSNGKVGVALSRPRADRTEKRVEGAGDERTETTVLHTPRGDLTSVRRIPEHKPSMVVKHFLQTDEEIERYLSIPYEPPQFDMARARKAIECAGESAIVAVGFAEPMYATATLFDFQEFCMRCMTDMPSVLRMIDWSFERCLNNVRLLAEAAKGMDVILHTAGPEVCTPPMMPPALFAKLVTPGLTKLVQAIHEGGLLAGVHCHGRVKDALPEIIRAGVDLLEPVEPPPQGDITLEELLEQAAGRICLMGHVQDQEFYTAAPGHMTRWVERIHSAAAGRTGYIMCPTCTPFEFPCSETYRRNYLEWLDAAERVR